MSNNKKNLKEKNAEGNSTEVRAEETENKRLGEAGHNYVGRQMDDDLKSSPRIRDEEDVTED